ncbi:MAG: hypothetical protein ABEI57_03860 [Halapricum sp.]
MTDTLRLGIDHYGYEHVLDRTRMRVVVLDSRGIDFQAEWSDFPDETTGDWERYVADVRGPWRETVQDRMFGAIERVFA